MTQLISQSDPLGTGAGPGAAADSLLGGPHHLLVVVAGAGVTAGQVTLQGTLDGSHWFDTPCVINVTGPGVYTQNLANYPLRGTRARISTNITGGTIIAQIGNG